MTYKQAIKTLAAVVGAAFTVSQVSAVEITIPDFTGPQTPESQNGITGVWGLAYGWNGGPLTAGVSNPYGEDNEVERISKRAPDNSIVNVNAAVKRQAWDLEGMSVGHADHLFLVGGYNFNSGIADGGLPGDLFIKIGPNRDTFKPLSNLNVAGTYLNGPVGGPAYGSTPGYNYAIHLSGGGLGSGGAVTVTVYDLNANTILQSDTNDNYGSNPWKVAGGPNNFDNTFTTTGHYYQGLTAAQVVTQTDNETAFAGLHGDTDYGNTKGYTTGSAIDAEAPLTNLHNVLDLDLGWLLGGLNTGDQVWFSYTMQCGNDSLKGHLVVPDGGTSLILMGGALSTLCLFGRRLRK